MAGQKLLPQQKQDLKVFPHLQLFAGQSRVQKTITTETLLHCHVERVPRHAGGGVKEGEWVNVCLIIKINAQRRASEESAVVCCTTTTLLFSG